MLNNKSFSNHLLIFACALLLAGNLFPATGSAQNNSALNLSSQKAGILQPVQTDINENLTQEINEQRRTIINEAVTAVNETQIALDALNNNKPQKALTALANATGKLSLIVARDPTLAFAPINISAMSYDFYAIPAQIKNTIALAGSALKKGDVQEARLLLTWLRSEMAIQIISVPLATYPAAIKTIAPLIDAGRLDDAKAKLQSLLHTLVITNHIIPLPYTKILALLKRVEFLSSNATANRSDQQNPDITALFNATRTHLIIAEMLGYGDKKADKLFIKQLDAAEEAIKKKEPTKDLFVKLQQTLLDITNNATSLINAKYKTATLVTLTK